MIWCWLKAGKPGRLLVGGRKMWDMFWNHLIWTALESFPPSLALSFYTGIKRRTEIREECSFVWSFWSFEAFRSTDMRGQKCAAVSVVPLSSSLSPNPNPNISIELKSNCLLEHVFSLTFNIKIWQKWLAPTLHRYWWVFRSLCLLMLLNRGI